MLFASLFNDAATSAGFIAASIAVGGFLSHAQPALAGKDEQAVKSATVLGGLGGFVVAASVSLGALLMR